jgi:hypothetical protein
MMMTKRALWIAALIAMLTRAAFAEPIIIINSPHNLEYGRIACSTIQSRSAPDNPEGIAECKHFDVRNLGRRFENEVRSQMATNTRCQGVDVFRLTDQEFDGKNNISELADQMEQAHWQLFLEYHPGQAKHTWTLFPYTGAEFLPGKFVVSGIVSGEGTASEIADQICIVVTKRGANIR